MTHRLRKSRTDIKKGKDKDKDNKNGKKIVLMSTPVMDHIVDEILEGENKNFFRKGSIQWKSFEDGFPNIFIEEVERLRGRDVVFIASFLEHGTLFDQLSVLYALPRYMVKSLIVVLTYFPTGTMERVDSEGQVATAATMTRLLSSIPISARGPTKVIIYDIHALQNRFYFADTAIPLMISAVPLMLDILLKEYKGEDVAIAFPDDGACKRFGKQFAPGPEDNWKPFETIICIKKRVSSDKRIVTIKEGDPVGKHVFIIDDLVKTGGTLIQCKETLLAAGAREVSAYVTHGVFPQDSWKRFTPKEGVKGFKKFYTTNSCPSTARVLEGKDPFEILSLAPSITDTILRY